jgi:hypothetical protein
MTLIAECEIDRHPWQQLRSIRGVATDVPLALKRLLAADSSNEADAAYWQLENVVVVQGQLYESAAAVVSVVLAALLEPRPSYVEISLIELLFQIVAGEADSSERAHGNADLGDHCRRLAREGLWTLYHKMWSGHREGAQEILERIETDPDRLAWYLAQCP